MVTQLFAKRHELFDVPDFLSGCEPAVLPVVKSVGDSSTEFRFAKSFITQASRKKRLLDETLPLSDVATFC